MCQPPAHSSTEHFSGLLHSLQPPPWAGSLLPPLSASLHLKILLKPHTAHLQRGAASAFLTNKACPGPQQPPVPVLEHIFSHRSKRRGPAEESRIQHRREQKQLEPLPTAWWWASVGTGLGGSHLSPPRAQHRPLKVPPCCSRSTHPYFLPSPFPFRARALPRWTSPPPTPLSLESRVQALCASDPGTLQSA